MSSHPSTVTLHSPSWRLMAANSGCHGLTSLCSPQVSMTSQRSRPGLVQVIGRRCISLPRWLRTMAVAPTLVRPSMKTCAVTLNGSPSSTRAGKRPDSSFGVTSMTAMRPNCDGSATGMDCAGTSPLATAAAVAAFVVLEARGVLAVVRLRGEVVRDVDCLPDEVRRVADFASVLSSECDVADRDELLLSADAPFFSSAIPPIVYG